jgi:predicted NAD-dependent protein-ADP-ribosyltransferase YbiA (DUF1768 family)
MTHQPIDLSDFVWLKSYLERQKNFNDTPTKSFADDGDYLETVSHLNVKIRVLRTNTAILEQARLAARTPGQAKLVYRTIMQIRDRLNDAETELEMVKQRGVI